MKSCQQWPSLEEQRMWIVKWFFVVMGIFLVSGCDRIDSVVPKTDEQMAPAAAGEPGAQNAAGTSSQK